MTLGNSNNKKEGIMPESPYNSNSLPTYEEIPAAWAWENHIQYEDEPTYEVTWAGGGDITSNGKVEEISNKFGYRGFTIDERVRATTWGLIRTYRVSHVAVQRTQIIEDNTLGAITSTIDFWIDAYGEPQEWEV